MGDWITRVSSTEKLGFSPQPKELAMAAAYHVFKNGALVAITKTGLTNPEIKKNLPHGPGNDSSGAVSKTPGKASPVTGK